VYTTNDAIKSDNVIAIDASDHNFDKQGDKNEKVHNRRGLDHHREREADRLLRPHRGRQGDCQRGQGGTHF